MCAVALPELYLRRAAAYLQWSDSVTLDILPHTVFADWKTSVTIQNIHSTAVSGRERLAKLQSDGAALEAEMRAAAAGANVAAKEQALAAIKAAAGERLLVEDDPTEQAKIRAGVRAAQAAVDQARGAERRYHDAHARKGTNDVAVIAEVQSVVLTEGLRLSEAYHHRERQALQAHAALEGLIAWAFENDSVELGIRLRELQRSFPSNSDEDPQALQRSQGALEAALRPYRDEWRAAAEALARDAGATGPDPEEIKGA